MGILSTTSRKRIASVPTLVGLISLLTGGAVHATVIGGIIWNDTNRNGIREIGEPPFTNAVVYLTDADATSTLATNLTDTAGNYAFTNIPNATYRIFMSVPEEYGITIPNAGGDDETDSDLVDYSFFARSGRTAPLPFDGSPITNIFGGFVFYMPEIHIVVQAGNAPAGQPLFVTNGTPVPFTYVISNRGDIALSSISIFDYTLDDFVGLVDCPSTLPNQFANSFAFASQRVISSSETNPVEVVAIAVNPSFCSPISTIDPVVTTTQTVVIVVTDAGDTDGDQIPNEWEIRHQLNPLEANGPASDADGDWMTDYEEYLADTDPTNAASFFVISEIAAEAGMVTIHTSSADRVYAIFTTSTLMENPQLWSNIAPEQTGTGSAIIFAITNSNDDATYRSGVRLP